MSASIKWAPTGSGKRLSTWAPSDFIVVLRRICGGDGPWLLDAADIPKLEGVIAATNDDRQRTAFEELVEAIRSQGEIRVWAEY